MTQTNPNLTVTLSRRRPVTIKKSEWPIISCAKSADVEAGEGTSSKLFVRQHADGRALVYGIYEGPDPKRGGWLVDPDDYDNEEPPGDRVAEAVRRTAQELGFEDELVHQCLAGLPAEEI